jgi:hypothetical protein
MLDFRRCFSPSLHWLNARDAVCGGTLLMAEVPRACRKVLGGKRAAGLLATASVARRRAVSLTKVELVTFY